MGTSVNKIMSAFAKDVKATPGGTVIGNGLRAMVNQITNGALGNGTMKRFEGESDEDYRARMKEIGASALGAADSAATSQRLGVKGSYVKEWLKRFGGKLIGFSLLLTTLVMLWKWWKGRKKGGRKKTWYKRK